MKNTKYILLSLFGLTMTCSCCVIKKPIEPRDVIANRSHLIFPADLNGLANNIYQQALFISATGILETGNIDCMKFAFPAGVYDIQDTPLMVAAKANDIEYAKALINLGADVNKKNKIFKTHRKDSVEDDTALHYAAVHTDGRIYELLLKHGADPKIKNISGLSPEELRKCVITRNWKEKQ